MKAGNFMSPATAILNFHDKLDFAHEKTQGKPWVSLISRILIYIKLG
jgi:hypothetical protein